MMEGQMMEGRVGTWKMRLLTSRSRCANGEKKLRFSSDLIPIPSEGQSDALISKPLGPLAAELKTSYISSTTYIELTHSHACPR